MMSRAIKFFSSLSPQRQNLLIYLLFLTVIALVFGQALFFDITYYDDRIWVKDLYLYLSRVERWWEFFIKPDLISEFYYRPLLNLSFLMNVRLGHEAIWPYHLTNLILHVVAVCFVFHGLLEWGMSRGKSLVGALIFAVHPAIAEAVVWIPGRTDTLWGVFCFAGFYFFLKYNRLNRVQDLCAYAVCLWGALLSKETAVVFGFMAFMMSFFLCGRDVPWSQRIRVPLATLCIGTLWLLMRAFALRNSVGDSIQTKWQTMMEGLPAIWMYLGKAFWPADLSVFPIVQDARLIYGVLSLIVLIVWFCLSNKKNSKKISWASAWFVLIIIPSLIIGELKYEYRIYVSLLGAVIVVLELFPTGNRRLAQGAAVAVIGIFAVISWRYAPAYADQWSFWPRAAVEAPHSALAQRNLGAMYHVKGDLNAAYEYYKKALALNPYEELANGNVGLIYQMAGKTDRAIEYFKREIQAHPTNYLPYFNLAQMRIEQKRWEEAERLLEIASRLSGRDADVYGRLIFVKVSLNKISEAGVVFQKMKALDLDISEDIQQQAQKFQWM